MHGQNHIKPVGKIQFHNISGGTYNYHWPINVKDGTVYTKTFEFITRHFFCNSTQKVLVYCNCHKLINYV